jgi:hypothetical protein
MIFSFTLVSSTHLPVSDYGTNTRKISLEDFLGSISQLNEPFYRLLHQARVNAYADLPTQTASLFGPKSIMGLTYHAPSLHWSNDLTVVQEY